MATTASTRAKPARRRAIAQPTRAAAISHSGAEETLNPTRAAGRSRIEQTMITKGTRTRARTCSAAR